MLDDTTRCIICRNAETMQGCISNATCEMLECGCAREDVLDTALGCFCDEMVYQDRALSRTQTESVSAFMDACLAEASILRRPDTETGQCELLPGYFSTEHHAIMSERIGEYVRIFFEFYQLYRQDEADGINVIELTTENFCDVLDDFGHEVTPELRNAVTEYSMLALFTTTAIQEALSSPF